MTPNQDCPTEQEARVLNYYRDHPGSDWVDCSQFLHMNEVDALNVSISLEMRYVLQSVETPTTIRCFMERAVQ